MSNDLDFMNNTYQDLPEEFYLPTGEYVVQVIKYIPRSRGEGADRKKEVSLVLAPRMVSSEDAGLTDDDLATARPVFASLYLHTEGAERWAIDVLKKANVAIYEGEGDDARKRSWGEMFEDMIGQYLRVRVKTETNDETGFTNVDVEKWYKANIE